MVGDRAALTVAVALGSVRAALRSGALGLVTAALLGCSYSKVVSEDPRDLPLADLDAAHAQRFQEGDALFDTTFRDADGLGPLYIRQACGACHEQAGRGPGFVEKLLVAHASLSFGPTVRPHVAGGARSPHTPSPDQRVATRASLPVWGRGLMEAIDERDIEALERAQAADGGVTGRINRVRYASQAHPQASRPYSLGQTGVVGRFGHRARVATLDDFTADALQGDMGLTSPLRPQELPNPDALADDGKAGVDVAMGDVTAIADYVRLLRLPRLAADPAGLEFFQTIGCAACHVFDWRTGQAALAPLRGIPAPVYTDLLLHDLGPSFAEPTVEGDAAPSEWRTAPLIGLRFQPTFLHDGRATTLDDAVRLHGGPGSEAKPSVDAYDRLTEAERAQLLRFLSTL